MKYTNKRGIQTCLETIPRANTKSYKSSRRLWGNLGRLIGVFPLFFLFFEFAAAEEQRATNLLASAHSVAQMLEDKPVGSESGMASSAVTSTAQGTCIGNTTPVVANGSRMIEFYNCDNKHFFYTRDPNEASSIDNGGAGTGWQRTGLSFDVESANGRNTGVCRFYGHPSIGPNSHFFTLEGAECEGLKSQATSTPYGQPRWNYEGTAFGASPVTAGACPSGTNALYRYYNNRGAQNDSNHRFSTVVFDMSASGWTPEGVVMCVGTTSQSSYPLTISLYGTGNGTVTSSPSGISCGGDCSESYSLSTTVTLAATASANANFTGWGGACSGTGSCLVTMDAARNVTATFAAKTTPSLYSLTISKTGTGDGQITSSPAGISCGSDCSESYSMGTGVALNAVASTNSSFTGWGGACSGTNGACTVTMSAAKSVTATFATIPVASTKDQICGEAQRLANMNLLPKNNITIGHYTDIFTPPQTKTECTHTYDTGIPDLSTCTTRWDPNINCWDWGWAGKGCVGGFVTNCTNIVACDTWASYKKVMNCDIVFDYQQIKYVDKAISAIQSVQKDLAGAVPVQCMSPAATGGKDPMTSVGQALLDQLKKKIEDEVKAAAEEAVQRWAVETIVTIIPSAGTSVIATTTAELIAFAKSVYDRVKPILEYVQDAKEVLGNAGLRTDCGWSDWGRI